MINLSSQSHLTRKREKVANIVYFNTVIQHQRYPSRTPKRKMALESHRSNLVPSIAVGKMGRGEGRRVNDSFPSMPRFLVFQCQCRRGSTLGARVKET